MTSQERAKAKRTANKALFTLCHNRYHDGLPVSEVIDILHTAGFTETDELVGVYCGAQGRVHEHVGNDVYLTFDWYKMPVSGRYEVNTYVS